MNLPIRSWRSHARTWQDIEHVKGYPARKAPEYLHRGGRTQAMEEAHPVLRRDYPQRKEPRLVGEREGIALPRPGGLTVLADITWVAAHYPGRQSYRLSDSDAGGERERGIDDWPIRYADVVPMTTPSGLWASTAEGLSQPDGQFQLAMLLNCAEDLIAGRLSKQFGGGRRIIPAASPT
jgi:hypothetical protein